MKIPTPAVLVITDRRQARRPLEDIADALFAGGCRWLSLREKDLSSDDRRALLRRVILRAETRGALVTVHDDLAAATALGIGIHLPAGGSIAAARRALGADVLIGKSAHTADEVARAAADGADYATLSPIFLSDSKPGYGPALGVDALRRPWPLPVLALGGIDLANAPACLGAGAAGVAVMGEAMRAQDARGFFAELRARLAGDLAGTHSAAHSPETAGNGRA